MGRQNEVFEQEEAYLLQIVEQEVLLRMGQSSGRNFARVVGLEIMEFVRKFEGVVAAVSFALGVVVKSSALVVANNSTDTPSMAPHAFTSPATLATTTPDSTSVLVQLPAPLSCQKDYNS